MEITERIVRDAADICARRYYRARAPISLADCILLAATGQSDELATADQPPIVVAEAERQGARALR